jgi:thiamine pyrophosphate-dependent acetolactate synthase large subunit-like protein
VRAWRTARNGRRTVVLNLPLDVQALTVDSVGDTPTVERRVPLRPGEEAVTRLVAALTSAQRPVFVAGRGARGYSAVLRELGERVGAVMATSAVAKGLFEGDPFDVGISGGFSSPLAAELITDADVLVAWGCSLTMWTMRHGRLIGSDTTVIQIDSDEDALGVNRPVDVGVVGDVGETARCLLADLPQSAGYRSPELAARIAAEARWIDVETEDLSTAATIDPRVLSRELDRRLPRERTLAVDSGNFMGYPSAYLSVPDEAGFCFTQAFQSIGLGLPTAIGAATARPDRLPVLGTGDGGLLMVAAELDTLVRSGIAMLVVVYNDAAYGAEVHHFGPDGADLSTVTFPDTDIAAIAAGYGLQAATVRTVADLDILDRWLAGPRTASLLLDAKVSNDGGSWWLTDAFQGH